VTAGAFDRAIAVDAQEPGRVTATLDGAWSTPAGLHGGYLAAVVLNAAIVALDRPERHARSLTLHYLSSPMPGPAVLEVTEERSGRRLSSLSVRLLQEGRTRVLALVALGGPYASQAEFSSPGPDLPPYDEARRLDWSLPGFPIFDFFEVRPTIGPVPLVDAPTDEAVTGGWIRLRDERPLDGPLLAQYVDSWWPAPFVRLSVPVPAPTIDLTIHFRADGALQSLDPGTPVKVRFTSRTAHEGFFEEDGELWAPDGTLLAISRQLAILPS
jgi:acyl-CoA thioesterase